MGPTVLGCPLGGPEAGLSHLLLVPTPGTPVHQGEAWPSVCSLQAAPGLSAAEGPSGSVHPGWSVADPTLAWLVPGPHSAPVLCF